MFFSLKAKIFLLITVTMAATAVAVSFFSDREISRAIMSSEEASVQNILALTDLNIRQSYAQLLNNRISSIERHKSTLQDLANLATSVLSRYAQLVESGKLRDGQAQREAIDWLSSARQNRDGYQWFLLDREARILAYSDQNLVGASVAGMTDLKGRALAPMLADSKRSYLVDFAVFYWNSSDLADTGKKLGYFRTVPEWGWTLVTLVDLRELEEEEETRKLEALATLQKSFTEIHIARTGTVFLLDGAGEMLIPPSGELPGELLDKLNPATNRQLSQDLTSWRQPGAEYRTRDPEKAHPYQVYFDYFKPFDWYIGAAIPLREIVQPANRITARLKQLIAIIFLASLAFAYFQVSRISQPLKSLTRFANQLPEHDFSTPMEVDPAIVSLAGRRRDEVGHLAQSFSFMVRELEGNIHRLVEVTAARERMAEELNIARKIQMGILPKTFPPFPTRSEMDLYALLHPAKEVGGDLYDFFLIDDQRLGFTLGDVSGKGIPAALFMMITRTLVKTTAQHFTSPAEIMEQVNNILSKDNPNTMFVTLIIGILDLQTGQIRYANGGHNPPIHLGRDGRTEFLKKISGPVVGAMPGLPFKELSLKLAVGESLLLYTDGVTEAMNGAEEQLGNAGLLAALGDNPTQESPEELIQRIMAAIKVHVDGAPQSDDIAMLALHYRGTGGDAG